MSVIGVSITLYSESRSSGLRDAIRASQPSPEATAAAGHARV